MGKREEFGKIYIYFIFALWSGAEILLNSRLEKFLWWDVKTINDQMAILILGLLITQIIFFQRYQVREMILIGAISLPMVLATLNSHHNIMMSTWIFIIAVKYIDFDKIVRLTYYVELIASIIVISLFEMGYISEYTTYRGSFLRHSLGFSHPNQLGVRIFLLVVCRCYIHRKRFNFLDWGIIISAAIFVNRVTNSKTSCYALIILAVLMAFYKVADYYDDKLIRFSNLMIIIAILSNVLSVFLSIIPVKKYPILKDVDRFMSLRFSQCHRTLEYYGIKMFGREVKLVFSRPGIGKTYHFWLDNAYMSILIKYGIVVFICFSALYIGAMFVVKNMEQHMLVAILCLYSIYGIMENNFFSMSQNLFLLLLSYPIYRNIELHKYNRNSWKVRITW